MKNLRKEIVCQTCNGKGIMPASGCVILQVCPTCKGQQYIDWITKASGRLANENMEMKSNILRLNISNAFTYFQEMAYELGFRLVFDMKTESIDHPRWHETRRF